MITLQEFRTQFPELNDELSDAEVENAILNSEPMAMPARAKLYAAAHLALTMKSDLMGLPNMIQIGEISHRFWDSGGRPAVREWMTSEYGRMAVTLIRQQPGAGVLTIGE